MKIWFSPLSYHGRPCDDYMSGSEKASECRECDDPQPDDCSISNDAANFSCNASTFSPVDQRSASYLAIHHLQLANTLHIRPCDTSHWLICNPLEAGKIAVLDKEALSWLENFHEPATLQEILSTKNTSLSHLLHATLMLIDLGFLYDLDRGLIADSKDAETSTLSA